MKDVYKIYVNGEFKGSLPDRNASSAFSSAKLDGKISGDLPDGAVAKAVGPNDSVTKVYNGETNRWIVQ